MKDEEMLIEEVKNIAVYSFKKFLRNLDLDPEMFKHIYEIPLKIMEINSVDDPKIAQYQSDEYIIIIDRDYLDQKMMDLIEETDDPSMINRIKINMALTLVHEMIHANRTIYINNGLSEISVEQKMNDELLEYDQEKNNHDLEQYEMLLNNILNKDYSDNFVMYIPIKVQQNQDGEVMVIAYNKNSKNYEQFIIGDFSFGIYNNADDIIQKIGQLLNSTDCKYVPNEIIYNIFQKDKNKMVIASDYYHQYAGKIVDGNDITSDLSVEKYAAIQNNKVNKILDQLENQVGFEETVTEVLSNIILMTRNDEVFDLPKAVEKIQQSSENADEKVVANLIGEMGINMLKWFMTSVYDSSYDDKMYKTFQEKYSVLLSDVNDLYQSTIYEEEYNQFRIDDANQIVEEKVGKHRI